MAIFCLAIPYQSPQSLISYWFFLPNSLRSTGPGVPRFQSVCLTLSSLQRYFKVDLVFHGNRTPVDLLMSVWVLQAHFTSDTNACHTVSKPCSVSRNRRVSRTFHTVGTHSWSTDLSVDTWLLTWQKTVSDAATAGSQDEIFNCTSSYHRQ